MTPLHMAIIDLWHVSRVSHSSRHDRMTYVKANLPAKLTQGMTAKAVWLAIEIAIS